MWQLDERRESLRQSRQQALPAGAAWQCYIEWDHECYLVRERCACCQIYIMTVLLSTTILTLHLPGLYFPLSTGCRLPHKRAIYLGSQPWYHLVYGPHISSWVDLTVFYKKILTFLGQCPPCCVLQDSVYMRSPFFFFLVFQLYIRVSRFTELIWLQRSSQPCLFL